MSVIRELNGLVVFLSVLLAFATYLRLINARDVEQSKTKANKMHESLKDLGVILRDHDNFPMQWGLIARWPPQEIPEIRTMLILLVLGGLFYVMLLGQLSMFGDNILVFLYELLPLILLGYSVFLFLESLMIVRYAHTVKVESNKLAEELRLLVKIYDTIIDVWRQGQLVT